jgi:hypothetical protein
MRWAGYVARTGEKTNAFRIPVANSEGKIHLEYVGIEGIDVPEENRVRGRKLNYQLQDKDKGWAVVTTVMNFRAA